MRPAGWRWVFARAVGLNSRFALRPNIFWEGAFWDEKGCLVNVRDLLGSCSGACKFVLSRTAGGPFSPQSISRTVRGFGSIASHAALSPSFGPRQPYQFRCNHRQNMPKTCRLRDFFISCVVGYMINQALAPKICFFLRGPFE